jgi:hypothetical protein
METPINLSKTASDPSPNAADTPAGSLPPGKKLRPLLHVEAAIQRLHQAGIAPSNISTAEKPLVSVMKDLICLGTHEVVAITRTLAQNENMNQLLSERAADVNVSDRHLDIVEAFNSIREDAAAMVKRAQSGKMTLRGKISERFMKMRRGTIHQRFQSIAKIATEVMRDTQKQLDVERAFAEAYRFMRLGIKEAQMMGQILRDRARSQMDDAREALRVAQEAVNQAPDADHRAILELARDEAQGVYLETDKRFQTAEDIYNNLTSAYIAGDVALTRLAQATDAKERVQRQAVSFFSTNQSVLTALATTITSVQGLNESQRTLRALKDGVNQSLGALADVGSQVQEAALKEGYTSGLDVEPIQKLVTAIVDYQERSHAIIREARAISAQNAEKLTHIAEEGRERLVQIIQRQALESTAPETVDTTRGLGYDADETLTTAGAQETLAALKAEVSRTPA